ncbi:Thioesterase/thiol ester dehydrase-isomerase [Athelia psychrophila]|uniref:Thioesterase/thiol ester dehydrase-isomerase n=1 Tax=Athelia psychrophila TaxID=1759441 RepID=A0A166K6W0_9AGAM|nr:Thioesterase/thiol ester dehydrase-isomerase [Fibularhizoctonia sp. CBS 109695]
MSSDDQNAPAPRQDTTLITGNASQEVKDFLCHVFLEIMTSGIDGHGFALSTGRALKLREISFVPKAEEPSRMEGRVVFEIIVDRDMANGMGSMHGGCTAYLIDVCTTLALNAYKMSTTFESLPSVSQSLNVVYHSPAMIGDTLRIVNKTITVGARTMTAHCEIWNETHKRQVATGQHIKMQPSAPKL